MISPLCVVEPLSKPPGWDDPPDNSHARAAVEFISRCPNTKGQVGSILGDSWLDWEDRLTRLIFGTVDDEGYRLIEEVYAEMAKKTGKSMWSAAVGLDCMAVDEEQGGEQYSAGYNEHQAKVVWLIAKRMIELDHLSPNPLGLADYLVIREYRNEILCPDTGSVWTPLSRGDRGKHGFNPSVVVFDELHEQPTGEMLSTCKDSMGARRQPLLLEITNAGHDRETVCYRQRTYTLQVNSGAITAPSFLGVIYGADPEDDWTAPETWRKAHPGLDVTVSEEWMAERIKKAKAVPADQNTVLRWQLSIWTQQVTRWLDPAKWESAAEEIDWDDYARMTCYGGLDLGSVSDLTAWALVFPDRADPELLRVKCRAWCPEARLVDRTNPYRNQYQAWARDNWLETTPGNVTDYRAVQAAIAEDAKRFGLVDMGMDVLFQGTQIATELQEDEGLSVFGMGTGMRTMSGPCKELERRLLMDPPRIRHDGNPVLAWAIGNVGLKQRDEDTMMPVKDTAEAKIDPVVALLMAAERADRHHYREPLYATERLTVLTP